MDDENPRSLIRSEISKYECEGLIDYLGTDENICKHIAASDCVVLPSYREGLSTTLV